MEQRRVVVTKTVSFLLGFLAVWPPVYGMPGLQTRTAGGNGGNKEYRAFFEYFQLQDTINFDYEGLLIGNIDSFIFLGTACVVFDGMSDSLFYIDLECGKYKALTVEDSLPGYRLAVGGMQRLSPTEFIVSSAPDYYIMFREGKVARVFRAKKYWPSDKFIVRDGALVSWYDPRPDQLWLAELNMVTGHSKLLFELREVGKDLRNLLFRDGLKYGALLYDQKAGFFIVTPFENQIYRYDSTGKLTHIYPSSYKNFKRIQHDAVDSSPQAVMAVLRSRKTSRDGVYSGYFLNENIIVLDLIIGSKWYLELFDKDTGRTINKEEILSPPWPVLYAADNNLFLLGPPRNPGGEDESGNLRVIRYLFKK